MSYQILHGDCLDVLRTLPDESVQCCVTSPPYWGLRDYGIEPSVWGGEPDCEHEWLTENLKTEIGKGNWAQAVNGRGEVQGETSTFREPIRSTAQRSQCVLCGAWRGVFGLEPTPQMYVEHSVLIFREVWRVLRNDGTLWLNIGDSYNAHPGQRTVHDKAGYKQSTNRGSCEAASRNTRTLKAKDIVGIPWRVAFALQADGWYLRQWCPWIKRNAMPESATDRPTTQVEVMFLMAKSHRYFYDAQAVKMPVSGTAHGRGSGVNPKAKMPGKNSRIHQDRDPNHPTAQKSRQNESFSAAVKSLVDERLRRSYDWFMDSWEGLLTDDDGDPLAFVVNAEGFEDAHFATFPPKLVEPCIKAGTKEGDTVLDPFNGAGTTGLVATRLMRNYIGIELNQEYVEMANRRIVSDAPLFNSEVTQ